MASEDQNAPLRTALEGLVQQTARQALAELVRCKTCGGEKDPLLTQDEADRRQAELEDGCDDAGDVVDTNCDDCGRGTGEHLDAWGCSECAAWLCEDCWRSVAAAAGGSDED